MGTEGGGILVAGPSGAGKSTVTMACLSAGFDFAGDDHVLLTFGEDGVVAHALYGTAKLHRDAPWRVPALAPVVVNHAALDAAAQNGPLHPDEKLVADIGRWRPGHLRDVHVHAVVIPRIVARPDSRLRRANPARHCADWPPARSCNCPESEMAPAIRARRGRSGGTRLRAGARNRCGSPASRDRGAAGGGVSEHVSVVIPVYQGERFLAQAIETVLRRSAHRRS